MTVRLGCRLRYVADAKSPIHLLVKLAPECDSFIEAESISHDAGEAIDCCTDAHGNTMLRTLLLPGMNVIRHSAVLQVPLQSRFCNRRRESGSAAPYDAVRYTLPSRYCESDKLAGFAAQRFAHLSNTWQAASAICDWTHRNLEYRHGSGDQTLSAVEAIHRGYGVCRDFAHVMIALCRALDIPARYVAGHIPLIGLPRPGSDIGVDFHAYVEVLIQGQWHVFDPRHGGEDHVHIKLAHGMDAVDTAIATFHGPVEPLGLEVWAYAVESPEPEHGLFSPAHSVSRAMRESWHRSEGIDHR